MTSTMSVESTSPHTAAALRWDTAVPAPHARHAATRRCSHVIGVPGHRYTPGCTATSRPAAMRRLIALARNPQARASPRLTTP